MIHDGVFKLGFAHYDLLRELSKKPATPMPEPDYDGGRDSVSA